MKANQSRRNASVEMATDSVANAVAHADITGDGKPEIVCSTGGKFGWFAPNWSKPTEKWPFVAVTDDMKVAKFTHGLGVGDVADRGDRFAARLLYGVDHGVGGFGVKIADDDFRALLGVTRSPAIGIVDH